MNFFHKLGQIVFCMIMKRQTVTSGFLNTPKYQYLLNCLTVILTTSRDSYNKYLHVNSFSMLIHVGFCDMH